MPKEIQVRLLFGVKLEFRVESPDSFRTVFNQNETKNVFAPDEAPVAKGPAVK